MSSGKFVKSAYQNKSLEIFTIPNQYAAAN